MAEDYYELTSRIRCELGKATSRAKVLRESSGSPGAITEGYLVADLEAANRALDKLEKKLGV